MTEQEIITVLKKEVQEKIQEDPHPKEKIHQVQSMQGNNTLKFYSPGEPNEANSLPRKYAGYVQEPYLAIVDIAA